MKEKDRAFQEIAIENEELRARLIDAETAIQAIRSGEVDAVLINGPDGEKIYTLTGADRTYRILVDAMSEGALVLSHAGIITYCNRTFATMLNISMSNVLGQSIFSFVSEPDIRPLRNMLVQFPSGLSHKELLLKGNGNHIIPVLFSIGVLDHDDNQSISAVVTNLTEQKQAEEKLENYRKHLEELVAKRTKDLTDSQLKYQALVESTNDFIWEVDPCGRYTYCSPQSEPLWGYRPEEMIGKTLFDFMTPESNQSSVDILQELKEEPKLFRRETTALNSSGEEIYLDSSGLPFFNDRSELAGYRGITRDITERKNTELELKSYYKELEASNNELESFSYSVSHDLKTPLRALIGFSEILIENYRHQIDETGQDYLNRIWKASQTMSRLINAMLRLYGIIRAEMQMDLVDISALANSIASELAENQPDRKVKFMIAEGITVNGDASLLQICLKNLLENAWKFTARNCVAVIEFGVLSSEDENVYYVKDNGIGFDIKYSGRLFKPFERLHSSDEFQGTGIGLAIVQRIIKRHGGYIWAKSAAGTGTTFFFTIDTTAVIKSLNHSPGEPQ